MALPLGAVDSMPHMPMAAHDKAHASDEALRAKESKIHSTLCE